MDEQKIIMLLWNRSETALQAISDAFGGRLYTIASNILQDHHEAEECLNDTYLALWNEIPPKRPHPLIAYACRIVRNIALNRRRDRHSPYEVPLEELAGYLSAGTLEEQMDAKELGQAINRFLSTVSSQSRVIFLRRYWFGDGVKEIAREYGMTENAVSVRLARTRAKLKTYLSKEGYV